MLVVGIIAAVWLLASVVAVVLCVAARRIDEDVAAGRIPTEPASGAASPALRLVRS